MALLSVATALATMALKFWSWHISGSVSLLSDAIESFVNLGAALLAFTVLTIAAQPADQDHPFGHDKAEYFSSAAEGLLILIAAVGIAFAAWERLWSPESLHALSWGLLIAAVAAVLNGLTAWKLFAVAKAEDSLTLRADAAHLLSDVWTSVAVIGGLMNLRGEIVTYLASLVSGANKADGARGNLPNVTPLDLAPLPKAYLEAAKGRNARRFKELYGDIPGIYVPQVDFDLTTR